MADENQKEHDFLQGDNKSRIDYVDCDNTEAQECLTDFIDSIAQEITVSCMIPFRIPNQAIAQIIKNAKEIFYRMYDDATEQQYLAVPQKYIADPKFHHSIDNTTGKSATRAVLKLPSNVFAVTGVYELHGFSGEDGGLGYGRTSWGDMALQSQMYANTFVNGAAIMADNMMYYVINASLLDQSRQIFQHPIGYTYNRLNKKLKFTGELPRYDVILDIEKYIEDCDLYGDYWFRRYIIASCKQQMQRILSAFQYSLPGNVSVNAEMIADEGTNEIQQILTELKDQSPNNAILMF